MAVKTKKPQKTSSKKKKKISATDGLGPLEIKGIRQALRQRWRYSLAWKLVKKRCTGKGGYTYCEICKKRTPEFKVDHIVACGDVDSGYIARLFVPSSGLQGMCKPCHDSKTKEENARAKKLKAAYEAVNPPGTQHADGSITVPGQELYAEGEGMKALPDLLAVNAHRKVLLKGLDADGNRVSETIEVPNDGSIVESKNAYAAMSLPHEDNHGATEFDTDDDEAQSYQSIADVVKAKRGDGRLENILEQLNSPIPELADLPYIEVESAEDLV